MNSAELVLGIDSSTQSTKAIAWDRNGRAVAEGRAPIEMLKPQPNRFEQDMEDWWRSLVIAIEQLLTRIDGNRIAAIAISNQRETIGFLDEHKAPVRPAMSWLDERGRAYVQKLSDELSGEWLHRTSGKPADLTPALFRLAWFCDNEPGACARTAFFVDVQSYLNYRLTGRLATSWASDTEQAAGQMSGNLYPCEPDPRNAEPYQALMQMQKSLYENNAAVFRKLKRFQSV